MEYIELVRCTGAGMMESAPVVLHEESAAGMCRAKYTPKTSPDGETVEDVLTLAMSGADAELDGLLTRIAALVEGGAREQDVPGGQWAYIRCRRTQGGTLYRSKILGGWLEMAGGVDQRASGAQRATLHLTRANYWEENELRDAAMEGVPLEDGFAMMGNFTGDEFSPGVAATTAGGEQATAGDLPAPVLLDVDNLNALQLPVTLAAMATYRDRDMHTLSTLAARAGVTGTTVADGTCVENNYLNLAWNGAGEVEALRVDAVRSSPSGAGWLGRPFRMVIRLGTPISTAGTEAIWARWKLYLRDGSTENLLQELEGQMLPQGEALVLGPVVNLPPWIPQHSAALSLRVVGLFQAAGTGAHNVRVDAVYFAAVDAGWRIFRPALGSAVGPLADDPYAGLVVNAWGAQTHTAEGPGLWLYPWEPHHFHFFFMRTEADGTKSAVKGDYYSVRMRYRARRRCL